MKQVLRWAGFALAGLAGVLLLATVGVYGASEIALRKTYPKAPVTLAASRDPGAVARGVRLAKIYGCNDCHGGDLTGTLFFDEMPVARISGANLTLAAAEQSDGDLARAIRTGVAADGRALWIMPSEDFAHLSDAETADLLAYLRAAKPKGVQHHKQVGPVGRIGLLLGKFKSAPESGPTRALPDYGPQFAEGRRLARACTECHGADLSGSETTKSPDLDVAAAYDPAAFEKLLRTGEAAGGRRLGLMSASAPGRFNVLTTGEIAALHAYLRARAEAAPAA